MLKKEVKREKLADVQLFFTSKHDKRLCIDCKNLEESPPTPPPPKKKKKKEDK